MAAERAKAIAEAIATAVCERIGSVSAAGESGVHSAGEMAAAHVRAAHAARSAESTSVATAALGAEGHCEKKRERRDGSQRAHTRPL